MNTTCPGAYWKRKHLSDEHKKHISESMQGITYPNRKSSPCPEETKLKISNALKGHFVSDETRSRISKNSAHFKYWLGKHHSEATKKKLSEINQGIDRMSSETRKRISEARKGKRRSMECVEKWTGENHWNWQGGITSLAERIRKNFKYRLWRSDVYHRDDFICQDCGNRGGKLHAHHLKDFSLILVLNDIESIKQAIGCEELWDINNGVTLCKNCHIKRHNKITPDRVAEVESGDKMEALQ